MAKEIVIGKPCSLEPETEKMLIEYFYSLNDNSSD